MKPALVLRGVTKTYGSIRALNAVDLSIPEGSLCGLVGPNGAGKTTCFGVIGGVISINAGEVDVLGRGPFRASQHKGRISLLPQDCQLNPHTSVRDLLTFYAALQGLTRTDARREADRTLEMVGLTDRARSRIRQLSHGMKRRVAVAQAFLGNPELVLLDEPMNGLDPHLVVHMRDLLRSRRGARTLVISSHVLSDLEAICDHVVFMEAGRCTRSGALKEITQKGQRVRIALEGHLNDGCRAALAGFGLEQKDGILTVTASSDLGVADLNARVLPILLQHGVRILEVRSGESLEAAYMAERV